MLANEAIVKYFKHIQVNVHEINGIHCLTKQPIKGMVFLRNELRDFTTEDSLRNIVASVEEVIASEMILKSNMFTPVFNLHQTDDSVRIGIYKQCTECTTDHVIGFVNLHAIKTAPIYGAFLVVKEDI